MRIEKIFIREADVAINEERIKLCKERPVTGKDSEETRQTSYVRENLVRVVANVKKLSDRLYVCRAAQDAVVF
jgi:hypothetical protein